MDEPRSDPDLDAMLRQALAPPQRAPDRAFVARVEREVAELERYRRWRARVWGQLASEGLAVAAIGGSLAFLGQIPGIREALAQAPGLAWTALLSLLLLWMLIAGGKAKLLA